MTTTIELRVDGMTCDHCVRAVREEVGALPGITVVDLDLPSGRLVVRGDAPLDLDRIGEAVEEAGYRLVGASP